jgi:hypothetical protein
LGGNRIDRRVKWEGDVKRKEGKQGDRISGKRIEYEKWFH